MPTVHRLREKSTAPPERVERVLRWHKELMGRLEKLREQFANQCFTALDEFVGRSSGYMVGLFKSDGTISLERLLMALDFFNIELHDFASPDGHPAALPRPAVGMLPALADSGSREATPRVLSSLVAWVEKVRVDESAEAFPIDAAGVIRLSQSHMDSSLRMAEGYVESLLARNPERLPSDTVEEISRLFTSLGYSWANRGQRKATARVLDLAFQLQEQIDSPKTTAYTFRIGAHLLADWGRLDDALMFVSRSERLCVEYGDVSGLGRTVYTKARLRGVLGQHTRAIRSFQACLSFLGEGDRSFVIAARHGIAISWLELGDLTAAERSLEEVADLSSENELTRAHFCSLRGEIASRRGDQRAALELFREADDLFARVASIQDRLILGLKWARHHLRFGEGQEAIDLVKELFETTSRGRESGKVASAVMLELLNTALVGELRLRHIESALQSVQQSPAVKSAT